MKQTMTIEVEVEDITWSPSREVYVVRYWDDARTLAVRHMTAGQLWLAGLIAASEVTP